MNSDDSFREERLMIVNKIVVSWKEHVFFPKETHTKFIEKWSLQTLAVYLCSCASSSEVPTADYCSALFCSDSVLRSSHSGEMHLRYLGCAWVRLGRRFWEDFLFLLLFPCCSVVQSIRPLGFSSLELQLFALLVDFLSSVGCSSVNGKNIFSCDSSSMGHHLVKLSTNPWVCYLCQGETLAVIVELFTVLASNRNLTL